MLPQYEIECLLGRGGMGAVYQGRQVELDRPVAIKILPPDLDFDGHDFAGRFKLEARAMARLKHPGIVTVYDFGQTAEGLLYFVMEFVAGVDVQGMIGREGRLHSADAIAIAAHVCEALHYAHSHGIIHRDIKPANVIVGYDGQVRVADFGLAKLMNAGQTSQLTLSGNVMGTPNYLAPEALTFGLEVDHRVDIYAVGVMLYHMLTGKVPYGAFEMPSLQIAGLDPRLDGIIGKAMREDREMRYQSAEELRSDLCSILTQPVAQTIVLPEIAAAEPVPAVAVRSAVLIEPDSDEDHPGYDQATTHAILRTTNSLNTTMLVLGGTALIILGALVFFLANRKTGDVYHSEQTITNTETHNTYFTQIIAAGLASAHDLEVIAEIRPYGEGFIGITREARSWNEIRELAQKAGAEVLSLDEERPGSRQQLLAWLTSSYSAYLTPDAWAQVNGEARVVQGFEVVSSTSPDQARKGLLYWQLAGKRITGTETAGLPSIPPNADPGTPGGEPAPAKVAPAPLPEKSPLPEWTNQDGRVIQAEFVEISGEAVVIRLEDGQLFTVPFSKLSPASVEQAMKLAQKPE